MTLDLQSPTRIHQEIERLMREEHLTLEAAVAVIYNTPSYTITTALAKLDASHDRRNLAKARLARKPYRDD
jgi:hypothetical protein